jgi:hypothetical protein
MAIMRGRRRCRIHGGRTKHGRDHYNYKHGGRSLYVPKHLRAAFEASMGDGQRLSLAAEIAMLDARLQQLYGELSGKAEDSIVWREIGLQLDRRGRLVDLETRHMRDLGGMVPVDQLFMLVDSLADIISREIANPEERARVASAIEAQLLGSPSGSLAIPA